MEFPIPKAVNCHRKRWLLTSDCIVCADGSASPDPCLWERNPDPMVRKVEALKKQLHIEMKVKQGAENVIQMYSTSKVSRNETSWTNICI